MSQPNDPVALDVSQPNEPVALADVALPVPLGRSFSYRIPERLSADITRGARVLCPFGRRKELGVVLAVRHAVPDIPRDKLRDLLAVVDAEPVLPDELLTFLQQLASYYFAPIGEVLRLALPAVERKKVRQLERQGNLLLGEMPGRTKQTGGRMVAFARATDAVEVAGSLRGQAGVCAWWAWLWARAGWGVCV